MSVAISWRAKPSSRSSIMADAILLLSSVPKKGGAPASSPLSPWPSSRSREMVCPSSIGLPLLHFRPLPLSPHGAASRTGHKLIRSAVLPLWTSLSPLHRNPAEREEDCVAAETPRDLAGHMTFPTSKKTCASAQRRPVRLRHLRDECATGRVPGARPFVPQVEEVAHRGGS